MPPLTPDPVTVLEDLTELQALAGTMYAEARGDFAEGGSSVEERLAVGCTVRNRLLTRGRFGTTFKAVCLQRLQYSCWSVSGGRENFDNLIGQLFMVQAGNPAADPLLRESLYLANGVMTGVILDATHGATHYYAPAAMVPVGRLPDWAKGQRRPVATVGNQLFFKGV